MNKIVYITLFIHLMFCSNMVIRNNDPYQLEFYTSYHQFYVSDKEASFGTNSDSFWTGMAVNDRLAVGERIIGVSTASYGMIKMELDFLKERNDHVDYSLFDHIIEASILINSGTIQILDCPNSNLEFETDITPGIYGVRVYSSHLDIIDEDDGEDFYKIELWPQDKFEERKVLKRYKK